MTSLWNERWEKMSFGSHHFWADAESKPLMGRFLLFYLLPIAGCFGAIGLAATMRGSGTNMAGFSVAMFVGVLVAYFLIGLVAMAFYAAFFREAVGSLQLGKIQFIFTASTVDWLKFILGNAALVIFTLGMGYVFVGYRNWTFLMRHLEATGEVSLSELTQSTTQSPTQGEGLLDALDIGAF
jgi:uncharacterized membrane protein YjgN (DUF898 family)